MASAQKSRPRVAFITNLCPYYRYPLFELLAERFATTFYFFSRGEEPYLGAGIEHEERGLPVREVSRIKVGGQPLLIGLSSELSRNRFDVVVKCINGRLMTPYVYVLAKRRRLPFILWTGMWHHPRTVSHRVTRPLVNSLYRGADAIVTYGDHVRRYVTAVPGVSEAKTYVAGQAIDTNPFAVVERGGASPPTVLFVGRLEVEKGLLDLLDAFGRVVDPHARLRVAGSGPLEPLVRARAELDPRIEPLGQVSRSELPRVHADTRCLVLPSVTTASFREPWGLVVNEAMASGLPVVATTAVGAAAGGLVRSGRNGLVVPERRPTALAGAIEKLLGDPRLAGELGAQARIDVAEFSYTRMGDAFAGAIGRATRAGGTVCES